jgi:hypothetical protein
MLIALNHWILLHDGLVDGCLDQQRQAAGAADRLVFIATQAGSRSRCQDLDTVGLCAPDHAGGSMVCVMVCGMGGGMRGRIGRGLDPGLARVPARATVRPLDRTPRWPHKNSA